MTGVLVRADASATIGTGHVMRCLVLAGQLRDAGMPVAFMTRKLAGNMDARIAQEGFSVLTVDAGRGAAELRQLAGFVHDGQAGLVIFDHYGLDAAFERELQQRSGAMQLCIDDVYAAHHADILLNPNIYAEERRYAGLVPAHCRCLCGLSWALLRDEFRTCAESPRPAGTGGVIRILVTLGGADPDNLSTQIVEALCRINDPAFSALVIVGAANRHAAAVQAAAAASDGRVTVTGPAGDMASMMRASDCVITGAGGTFIETLYCDLPALLVNVAPNQDISYAFARTGKISYLVDKSGLMESIQAALQAIAGDTDIHRTVTANRQRLVSEAGRGDLAGVISSVLAARHPS